MQNVAPSQTDEKTDELEERFFSQPPQAWEVAQDDWQLRRLSSLEQVAMLATLATPAVAVVAALCLLLISASPLSSATPSAAARSELAAPEPVFEAPAPVALAVPSPRQPPVIATPPPALEAATEPPPPTLEATDPPRPAPEPAATGKRERSRAVTATTPTRTARAAGRATAPASQRVKRARRALSAGKAQEAKVLASEAVRLDPAHAAAYIVLAGALDALGERAAMKDTLRTCVLRAHGELSAACKSLAR